MDNKAFLNTLSRKTGLDFKETSRLTELLSETITAVLSETNSVAIPGFGKFSPVKHLEKTVTDSSTGRLLLLPPKIEIQFVPATSLTRKIGSQQNDR